MVKDIELKFTSSYPNKGNEEFPNENDVYFICYTQHQIDDVLPLPPFHKNFNLIPILQICIRSTCIHEVEKYADPKVSTFESGPESIRIVDSKVFG